MLLVLVGVSSVCILSASDEQGKIKVNGSIYSAQFGAILVTQNEACDFIYVYDEYKKKTWYEDKKTRSCTLEDGNCRFFYLPESSGEYLIPYIALFLKKKKEYLAQQAAAKDQRN